MADEEYEVTLQLTENCDYLYIPHFKIYQRALKKWLGKDLVGVIRVKKYKRSLAQNGYMFSVIVPMVRHWYYETHGEKLTKDEVYTWLRVSLIGETPKIVEIEGMQVITMTGKKFSAMNTAEFASAVDTIRAKMLERGLDIPEPSRDKNRLNLREEFIIDN